jgi:hypothetical protein
MEAVKNFDPYRGVRFPSYAVWWIRAYIIRYVINNWRMVKLGTTQAQRKLFFNLQKEKDRLEREGFVAGPKLLADRLGVKEKEIVEMQQRLGASDLSVDMPLREGEESTLLDVLQSGAATRRASRRRRGVPLAGQRAHPRVRRHAEGQGSRHLRSSPARRGPAHAPGDRRSLRDQPRARPADRKPGEAEAQRVSRGALPDLHGVDLTFD